MKAPGFDLLGVDGKRHSPASARGDKGLVVMFICNHCPYVKRSLERILSDCRELQKHGIGSIAVMPNDPGYNAEDSFDNMKRVAREKGFPFPYVIDETQDVARAYDAVCTPDFFGFDSGLELRYHGRLEDLVAAMAGTPPQKVVHSIGCSIKWRK
jgi:peroxiredoxin